MFRILDIEEETAMKKNVKQWYKNLKFRRKVLLGYIAVGLIPVIILGIFSYAQVRHLLIEREKQVLDETLKQNVTALEGSLTAYKNFMDSLVWNANFNQAVTEQYETNFQMYLSYRDVIDPMISNIRNLNPSVERITVYTSNESLYPHGNHVRPLSEIGIQTESLKDSRIHWNYSENKKLELYCKIYSAKKSEQNIVYMQISDKQTLAHLKTLFQDDYGIFILDENDDTVFSYLAERGGEQSDTPGKEEMIRSGRCVVKEAQIQLCKWNIVLYRPVGAVSNAARSITILVLFVILICAVLTLLASSVLSKSVVRPIRKLVQNVEQVEAGRLTVEIQEESSDEIGHLVVSFQRMVKQLNYMINEVYQSKITQQEYEMKALQAQINPHFLYNSLSLINWKAIIAEQEEISEMAQLLSTFYRTTLNKGKNVTTVKGEWDNTCSYIRIQRMMHSGKFEAVLEIEDSILDYEMLNLLLQPLVENAIVHGLDHKETEGVKRLSVSGRSEDGVLVFQVSDNGCGMTEDVLCNILTAQTSGYGVQNVHHRIQLYYGEEYGLAYESKRNAGTTVRLTIPIAGKKSSAAETQPPAAEKQSIEDKGTLPEH